MPARLRDTGGFALAMAVFALVLLAAVVAGGYFSASQEFQIGQGMKSLTSSFYAGESGIRQVFDDWDPVLWVGLQPGESTSVGPLNFEGGGSYSALIVRVGRAADSLKRYFYVESSGRPRGPRLGERRQAVMARSRYPNLCCDAAAEVINAVDFGGGAQPIISGINSDPPSPWPASACTGLPGDNAPGVIFPPWGATNDTSRIVGVPDSIRVDSTLSAMNLFVFDDLTYNDIVAQADHQFVLDLSFSGSQPSVVDGKCDRSDSDNWGNPNDPGHPCFNYFPVMHVMGNLDLVGSGYAQGILLVDGDMKVTGPFTFYGILLVKGDLRLGGPVDVYGGALVGDSIIVSGATPRFWLSRCATERAERLSSLARPRLLSPRAWVELF